MKQTKFKNKYRTTSCRLQDYDYSSNGMYFITICCSQRKSFFGEIVDGKMILNELGKFANSQFKNTENIRGNVTIDEFVIMPDHVHGIISIDYQELGKGNRDCRDTVHRVSTLNQYRVSTSTQTEQFGKPTKNSIPTIIRSFKSVVTTYARKNCKIDTLWQKKYFDRIVRNEDELNRIREYIILNPLKWEYDENKPENIYY